MFLEFLSVQFFLSIAILQIAPSLTDGLENIVSSESGEYSSIFGGHNRYSIEEENYDLIFEDEETPGVCSQILHRRLIQFLKNVGALNSTRQGRQDDGDDGDDGGDGDGDAAAGAAAPVEVLGLELPAAVPQFFKVVANALVSNESAATVEMGFKALAPVLQNQITGAVSLFANVLQGGSPFAPQGPAPTRPAAPIRQWPSSNTRRPTRPRPTQSPLRPSYSEEESGERGPQESSSGERRPGVSSSGERKPAAGSLPPKRRRSTTTSPEKQSTSKEEEDVESDIPPQGGRPAAGQIPIIRKPSAGSLNRFYATTQKVQQGTDSQSESSGGGGGSLNNLYATAASIQKAPEEEPQSQIGSLKHFYSTTPKIQQNSESESEGQSQAQIGSLNQFYSTTAKIQERVQPGSQSQAQGQGVSLNQFYAPRPKVPQASEAGSESQSQIGSLKDLYSTTPKAQEVGETDFASSKAQEQPNASVQETKTPVQIGSLKQFYAGSSNVQEFPSDELKVEENSAGKYFSTTAEPDEENEPEIEETGSGGLKQFYSSTPNVKIIIEPENSGNQGIKPTQGSNGEPNGEMTTHVQWGALRRFYSSTTKVPDNSQNRLGEDADGQEKFANALLSSVSQVRRKPATQSQVVNSEESSETKFTSLFKPNPPPPPATNAVGSTSPPKRRRRTTTTTESVYYDDDTTVSPK